MAEATQPKAAAKKAAPKRKAPAKRKPAAKRKAAPRATAATKMEAEVKKVEAKVKKASTKVEKTSSELASKAKESGHSALLVGLGCYGMAYDEMLARKKSLMSSVDARKKKADKLYKDLVKRGTKVEKEAIKVMDSIELPKIDIEKLTDPKFLESRLDKAKTAFADFKSSATSRFA